MCFSLRQAVCGLLGGAWVFGGCQVPGVRPTPELCYTSGAGGGTLVTQVLRAGGSMTVRLVAAGGTGYGWEWKPVASVQCALQQQRVLTARMGGPVETQYVCRAQETQVVEFQLRRPWEATPIEIYRVKMQISPGA